MKNTSLTREELDALLAVALKYSECDYLMFSVTFNHGLRASETLSLTLANFVDGHLIVQRLKKSEKTAQKLLDSERLGLESLAAAHQSKPMFPIHRVTFWRKMQRYGAEAGIPRYKCHPHVLKHSCGRLAFKAGLTVPEVASILGHKNVGNAVIYGMPEPQEAFLAFAKAVGK